MVPSPCCICELGRRGELGGFAGGGGQERGAIKILGEDVPACVEFAVRVGDHLPRFERLLDGVCFDHNHVHGFAGLESGAVEIDIGKWRVIFAIGGEGRLVVRRLGVLGVCRAAAAAAARLVARLNTCEASGSYSFFAKWADLRRAALSAAVRSAGC